MARRAVGAVIPRSHYFPFYLESANFRERRGPNPAEGQRGFQATVHRYRAGRQRRFAFFGSHGRKVICEKARRSAHVIDARAQPGHARCAGSWQAQFFLGGKFSELMGVLEPWTYISGGFHPQCKRDCGGPSLHFEVAAPIASCRDPHRL